MKWHKFKIELDQLDKFCEEYTKKIKRGDVGLDHCYCVFKFKDTDIPQMMLIFDFLDFHHNNIITNETISILYIYQPFV